MKLKISSTSKMLLLSVAFTFTLVLVRFLYTGSDFYRFYLWNTFLAAIPYVLSTRLLRCKGITTAAILLMAGWLLFLPNAPYMVTDLFHYQENNEAPYWYDLFIVITGAWNGIALGLISLMNVEKFFSRHVKPIWVNLSVFLSIFLCSYGVYIGRFYRFNSWDIVSAPKNLAYTSAHHFLMPVQYPKVWVFTILCSIMLALVYFTLKKLPVMGKTEQV